MPVYANVKEVIHQDGHTEAIEIHFLTFYAHNGTYDVGYVGLFKVGSHDGDWEHCTVRSAAFPSASSTFHQVVNRNLVQCFCMWMSELCVRMGPCPSRGLNMCPSLQLQSSGKLGQAKS